MIFLELNDSLMNWIQWVFWYQKSNLIKVLNKEKLLAMVQSNFLFTWIYLTSLNMATVSIKIKKMYLPTCELLLFYPPFSLLSFRLHYVAQLSIPCLPCLSSSHETSEFFELKGKVDAFLRFSGFNNLSDKWKLKLNFVSLKKRSVDISTPHW